MERSKRQSRRSVLLPDHRHLRNRCLHRQDKVKTRTRKEQSFLAPVEDIRANDYDLSLNKYKEVEREMVVYDAPQVIMGRIEALEKEIVSAFENLKTMMP